MSRLIIALLTPMLLACSDDIVRTIPPVVPPVEEEALNEGAVENEFMTVYQVDPLIKLIPDPCNFPSGNDTIRVARGETATLQLVVNAKRNLTGTSAELVGLTGPAEATLSGATIGWVRYVRSTYHGRPQASDHIVSPSNRYPDPIIDDETESIGANEHRSLWVSIPIPESTEPGLYSGTVRISAIHGETPVTIDKSFRLQVYPVNVGEPKLFVTNWIFFWFFEQMNRGVEVQTDSPLYWEMMETLAKTCKSIGNNTYRFDRIARPVGKNPDGSLKFDFSPLKRLIEFFIEHGGLKRIELSHLAAVRNGWGTDYYFLGAYYYDENGNLQWINPWMEGGEEEYKTRSKSYFKDYFSSLYAFMQENGWQDKVVHHIGDEPTTSNSESWIFHAKIVREAVREAGWTELRFVDAMDTGSATSDIPQYSDIMVPTLHGLHEDIDIYAQRIAEGHETWMYTCMFPQGEYANRFVNLPLLKTRILHWLNYKSGTVGYLHWGLTYWHDNLWQDIYQDCSNPGSSFPGGDPYILYPGYRKLYSSIRANAMRDGIHDYNLLKMVEERDPAKAKAFLEAVVLDYDRYDMNVPHFRQIRKEMLEFLSGTSD